MGSILNLYNIKTKCYRRNNESTKFIRVFLYKTFLYKIYLLDNSVGTIPSYSFLFFQSHKIFINILLNSVRYTYFVYPDLIYTIKNKKYKLKNKKAIKRRIIKNIVQANYVI